MQMARANVDRHLFQGEGVRSGKGANDRVPAVNTASKRALAREHTTGRCVA